MSRSTLPLSLLVFGSLAFATQHARADGAALLPLMAPDLLEPQKRALEERIRVVAADNGLKLQPHAETAQSIEDAKKAGAACNIESLACQAQMGVLLGVDQVIVARVASDWAGDRLELRLLDALGGTTLREAARLLPKDDALRTRVTDGIILAVLAPSKAGAMKVVGATGPVFVDGVTIANVDNIDALAPGPHDLEMRPEGKPAVQKQIVVSAGETATVELGPPTSNGNGNGNGNGGGNGATGMPLGAWLIGGGAVLAAAAGAGAGGLQAALEYSAMERGTRDALQVTGISLLGATAVGVVVAGAGGVMLAMAAEPEGAR